MADYLGIDLNKFEGQMMNFIEVYYNILKEEKEKPLSSFNEKNGKIWNEQIINLLKIKIKEKNRGGYINAIEVTKKLLEDAEKNGKVHLEFFIIMNLVETLFEIYFNIKNPNKKKSSEHIKKNMARCICREIIELRNELSHNENPPSEYILRFYEDQYYLIKFMRPDNPQIELSNYTIKDIKTNIHTNLSINLNNENSFELFPLKEEFINFEKANNINNNQSKNIIINIDRKEAIKSLFTFTPFKLPKYNFSTQNDEEEKSIINNNKSNEKEDEEDKEVYEPSLDNVSRNSLSAFSDSKSSERSSFNENNIDLTNIKEEESSINLTNETVTDLQKNM